MEVTSYEKKYLDEWESFVEQSNNGTLFHTRKFLAYHPPDRFKDHSLIFMHDKKIVALINAADVQRDGKRCLISHQGASFGGFIYKDSLSLKQAFDLTESLIEHCKENKFEKIIITHAPFVYQKRYNNYIDFAFMRNGFDYLKREVSSVVVLDVKEDDVLTLFKPEARTSVRRAQKLGVEIRESEDYASYYKILKNNLALRHNVNPAHTLEEIIKLKKLFPDKIKLFGAFVENKMIAGVINFYCNSKAVLVFYISNDMEFQQYRAVNLLFYTIIKEAVHLGLSYLDFGLFTVNMEPNWGLGRFKENFGARGILRDTFYKNL